ncbi:hypothetical protein LINPERPRIM_LOCUS34671 [Linum perenne]
MREIDQHTRIESVTGGGEGIPAETMSPDLSGDDGGAGVRRTNKKRGSWILKRMKVNSYQITHTIVREIDDHQPRIESVTGGEGIPATNEKRGSWISRRMKVNRESLKWRWKFLTSAFKWKRVNNLQISLVDDVLFKVVSALEAVVLVATVSFFYLCCGCHF